MQNPPYPPYSQQPTQVQVVQPQQHYPQPQYYAPPPPASGGKAVLVVMLVIGMVIGAASFALWEELDLLGDSTPDDDENDNNDDDNNGGGPNNPGGGGGGDLPEMTYRDFMLLYDINGNGEPDFDEMMLEDYDEGDQIIIVDVVSYCLYEGEMGYTFITLESVEETMDEMPYFVEGDVEDEYSNGDPFRETITIVEEEVDGETMELPESFYNFMRDMENSYNYDELGLGVQQTVAGWLVTVTAGSWDEGDTYYCVEEQGTWEEVDVTIRFNDLDGDGNINAGDNFVIEDVMHEYEGYLFAIYGDGYSEITLST